MTICITCLIIALWTICGILSRLWQKLIYTKDFGRCERNEGVPLLVHIIMGPISLMLTFLVDYYKIFVQKEN